MTTGTFTSSLSLGVFTYSAYGYSASFNVNLIAPFITSDGRLFYYLDGNGDGIANLPDVVLREGLDHLFTGGSDTSSTSRTTTFGNYVLSLPTTDELAKVRQESGNKPPTNWAVNGASTYHAANVYAENGHSIFGLSGGTVYERPQYESDSLSNQYVAIEIINTAPVVSTLSPIDGANGVSVGSNIMLTFNEAIQRGTGNIEIRQGSATGALVESFAAATSTRLAFSGSTLTIDPNSES
jgi:hypothetical protein